MWSILQEAQVHVACCMCPGSSGPVYGAQVRVHVDGSMARRGAWEAWMALAGPECRPAPGIRGMERQGYPLCRARIPRALSIPATAPAGCTPSSGRGRGEVLREAPWLHDSSPSAPLFRVCICASMQRLPQWSDRRPVEVGEWVMNVYYLCCKERGFDGEEEQEDEAEHTTVYTAHPLSNSLHTA